MENKRTWLYILGGLAGTALLVLLDQWTKHLAVTYLAGGEDIVLIPGVFQLQYLENRGAAFGLFQGQRTYFLLVGVIVFIACLYLFARMSRNAHFWPIRLIAVCILAGAWGNMIDRLRYAYVVDFFYFKLIDFPIFNVADIYVSVGTAALAVLILFYYKDSDLEELMKKKSVKEK